MINLKNSTSMDLMFVIPMRKHFEFCYCWISVTDRPLHHSSNRWMRLRQLPVKTPLLRSVSEHLEQKENVSVTHLVSAVPGFPTWIHIWNKVAALTVFGMGRNHHLLLSQKKLRQLMFISLVITILSVTLMFWTYRWAELLIMIYYISMTIIQIMFDREKHHFYLMEL